MTTTNHPARPALPAMFTLFALAALPLLVTSLLPGCADDPGYEHVYTTRGVVVTLPGGAAYNEFMVHHEQIPDYVSISGSLGMNEMVMPFPVPDKSVLDGLAVGDKIELTFGEVFKPRHEMGVISIKKLPADTVMSLSQTESQ